MIIVTGAAGFIGSCLVAGLNDLGYRDIVVVDDFSIHDKNVNLNGKFFSRIIHRTHLFQWLKNNHQKIQFVFHLGARTDTTLFDEAVFNELNLDYSKDVWNACVLYGFPLVYASSAATYGDGAKGYDDQHSNMADLLPLNPYGASKQAFDVWALKQDKKPYFWAGLKFFNVYGPNEYHKGRMASVVLHAFKNLKANGTIRLFRSHRAEFSDGGQLRDFIYVKDVVSVCNYFLENRRSSGIYNLGTGQARTFLSLADAVFQTLGIEKKIEWIDTPEDIREKYQYFTEAKMAKLRSAGYSRSFYSLEDGVKDYILCYLNSNRIW